MFIAKLIIADLSYDVNLRYHLPCEFVNYLGPLFFSIIFLFHFQPTRDKTTPSVSYPWLDISAVLHSDRSEAINNTLIMLPKLRSDFKLSSSCSLFLLTHLMLSFYQGIHCLN